MEVDVDGGSLSDVGSALGHLGGHPVGSEVGLRLHDLYVGDFGTTTGPANDGGD